MTSHDSPWVVVFEADQAKAVREAALVLNAVGIKNTTARHGHGWVIWVEQADQANAHGQLASYWQENLPSPEQPVAATTVDNGWFGVVGYLFIIWLIPALSTYTALDFRSLGRLDAGAVIQGDWWRAATALTLHADIGHIASNSLFGCVFGLFVGRYLGSGLGWLLVLVCGIVANCLNAIVQPEQFRAIGASTATFAALGIVPAFGWRRGFFRGRGFKRGFAPIFGAIALLAFTGFSAENVDVLGHLFGFAAGIGMGLLVAHIKLEKISLADQQRAGAAAFLILGTAWLFALI
jgi:membrane associated rhomboid family serine protease